jgi:lysophospholipase L1-like esterase
MEALCAYIVQQLPSVRLIVSTVPPDDQDPGNDSSTELGQYNASLSGLTSVSNRISIVNSNALMTVANDIGPDGLHPNDAGDAILAQQFVGGINALYSP